MSIQSFNAVCNHQTQTLIVGTMPGIASLNEQQYYAHKRNALWPILLAAIHCVEPDFALHQQYNYKDKLKLALQHGFGLWDVLAQCERPGSLDSAIKKDSVVVNDFVALLANYPEIKVIVFNGKTAARLFFVHAKPLLIAAGYVFEQRLPPSQNKAAIGLVQSATDVINRVDASQTLELFTMPSTSPAMASLTLQEKSKQWRYALMRLHG